MKAGTFDAYPSHSADPYRGGMSGSRDLSAASRAGKYFIPSPGPKSAPSTSVLDQNIVRLILLLFLLKVFGFGLLTTGGVYQTHLYSRKNNGRM